jgi:hypothetical protein
LFCADQPVLTVIPVLAFSVYLDLSIKCRRAYEEAVQCEVSAFGKFNRLEASRGCGLIEGATPFLDAL